MCTHTQLCIKLIWYQNLIKLGKEVYLRLAWVVYAQMLHNWNKSTCFFFSVHCNNFNTCHRIAQLNLCYPIHFGVVDFGILDCICSILYRVCSRQDCENNKNLDVTSFFIYQSVKSGEYLSIILHQYCTSDCMT